MYAPRVFVSMLGALAVFAIATYWLNGSLTTTIIETAVCAVLLQVGYFGGVLFLVWKESQQRRSMSLKTGASVPGRTDEAEKLPVTPFNGSEPLNH